jgi:hypothetical protein
MGIFSVKATSPEKIEPHVQYHPGLVSIYLDGKRRSSGNSYDVAHFGAFSYFFQTGTYFLSKSSVKFGDKEVPSNDFGTQVFFNTSGKRVHDENIVSVQIPLDPYSPRTRSRLVDMSGKPFAGHLDNAPSALKDSDKRSFAEASFCVSAIAKGIYEHLHDVEEPAWMREKIDTAHAVYDAKEPQFEAHISSYVEIAANMTPQPIDFGDPRHYTE